MGTIAVTGSAGGMGRAVRTQLERQGHEVLGVDVVDSEVTADLSNHEGREAMVEAVTDLSGGRLAGLVVAAGLQKGDPGVIVGVNHFGAVATLEGLRPLLQANGEAAAVVVSSNSTTTMPGYPTEIADACRWARRAATADQWIGSGIRLNVIAPGFVDTPMTEGGWEFVQAISDVYPVPVGRPGTAEEAAGLIGYLLSPAASFFCGSFIVMDGGTDAALRPDDWPRPLI